MASIQKINIRVQESQKSFREKIEKDVYNLIDNDESNNYDPTTEYKCRAKHSVTTIEKEKLKQTFSTQPYTEKSFNYSKSEFIELNFEKKIKDIFLKESLFVDSPSLKKAFDEPKINRTFVSDTKKCDKGINEGDEERFNPFKIQNQDVKFRPELARFGQFGFKEGE